MSEELKHKAQSMTDKKALCITVETGACSFAEAASAAIEMASEVEFVSLRHNGTVIDVCPDWSPRDCEVAWSYAAMASPLGWRRLASDGHPYSPVDIAEAMVRSRSLHDEVMGRIAQAREQPAAKPVDPA